MTESRKPLVVLVLCSVSLVVACDPQQMVRTYYATMGLNQLAVPRDDIEPGGVILSDRRRKLASYADNIFDYADGPTQEYAISGTNAMYLFNAALRSWNSDRTIEGPLALEFLDKILPVSVSGSLALTSKVTIAPVQAKVKRMKIPALQRYLSSRDSTQFRETVKIYQQNNSNLKVAIIYEVYRAKEISLVAQDGNDVASSVAVGQVGLVGSAQTGFKYNKLTKSELVIQGDNYYAFAVRAALIEPGTLPNTYLISQFNFSLPGGWGIQSAGTEITYSTSVIGEEFEALDFVPISELGL